MLIVEGPDNVGKTTLCERLVRELNALGFPAVYRHFSRLPDCWDYYRDYLPHVSRFAVMDRFWMSELAYAHARGDLSPLDRHKVAMLEGHLLLAGSLTVLVTAEENVIRDVWGTKKEMYPVEVVLKANDFFQSEFVEKQQTRVDMATYRLGRMVMYPSSNGAFVHDVVMTYLDKQRNIDALAQGKVNYI
jgi:hypothetical protein